MAISIRQKNAICASHLECVETFLGLQYLRTDRLQWSVLDNVVSFSFEDKDKKSCWVTLVF